jgi:hypothetical protein
MAATVVALPTQQDLDAPVTPEARGALAMASHMLAAIVERRCGCPTSAHDVYQDAQQILTVYTRQYRRLAARQDASSEKVD